MSAAPRILIVEDNQTSRSLLVGSRGKAGYDTLEASNGITALRMAREELPDLILLDVSMPGQDGAQGLLDPQVRGPRRPASP